MAEEYTKNQLNYLRSKGVSEAWARERALVSKGRGTRNWSVAEQKELLRTGRVKGYQGHHMKSVSKHPDYAAAPKNIQFLDARKGNNEHLKAHKGNYRNESDGRYNVRTGGFRPMGDGKPRAMNSYELKDKAIEKRGYAKYKYSVAKKADRSRAAKKGTAKQSTTFNGKNYQRSMVRQPGKKGPEKVSTSEKTKARTSVKPRASAQSGSGKSVRYGEKTAARSPTVRKSSSGYEKAKSSPARSPGSSNYGKSVSRGSSGGSSKGGVSHSYGAGKGR